MKAVYFILFALALQVQAQNGDWQITSQNSDCCNPVSTVTISTANDIINVTGQWQNSSLCADSGFGNLFGETFNCTGTTLLSLLMCTSGSDSLAINLDISESTAVWSYPLSFGSQNCTMTLNDASIPSLSMPDSSLIYTLSTPSFLIGQWELYESPEYSEGSYCYPSGILNIEEDTSDAGYLALTSSDWTGTLCELAGIDATTKITFFLNGTATLDDFPLCSSDNSDSAVKNGCALVEGILGGSFQLLLYAGLVNPTDEGGVLSGPPGLGVGVQQFGADFTSSTFIKVL